MSGDIDWEGIAATRPATSVPAPRTPNDDVDRLDREWLERNGILW